MGRAVRVEWYTQGRRAQREEVQAVMEATLATIGRNAAIEKRVAELLTG
jgi:hypothetical protein